jgi:ribose/xylose/arabinose/galactoside ABC-type transport system permease subunit
MIKKLMLSAFLKTLAVSTAAAGITLQYAEGSPNRGARADAMPYFAKDVGRLSNTIGCLGERQIDEMKEIVEGLRDGSQNRCL